MSEWSRRHLMRASGAAAVAVPMSALISTAAEADMNPHIDPADLRALSSEPVMFVVNDAARGEISILHGEREVVVHDRDLVARIARAARTAKVG